LNVPLLDLRLQYTPVREEVLSAIRRACDDQQFIMGPAVERLEAELAVLTEPSAARVAARRCGGR
jgi:dTDP-4-amino-4,6-dideoxygalactose transaminase